MDLDPTGVILLTAWAIWGVCRGWAELVKPAALPPWIGRDD